MKLDTFSLRASSIGQNIIEIINAALQAVDPAVAISNHLARSGKYLYCDDLIYDLENFRRILLVGAGKAGAPMAGMIVRLLGSYLDRGVIVVKEGYAKSRFSYPDKSLEQLEKIEVIEAGHPLPDQRSLSGTQTILNLLSDTTEEDLVICLISGGGSSLLVAPHPGIKLDDLQKTTALLLACGASIHEINTLRKHLDQVKGGGLARAAAPATLLTLVLSDVVGDNFDVIASGPTSPDSSTFDQSYRILERYDLIEKVPSVVITHITRGMEGDVSETLKDDNPVFARVKNIIIGNNKQAALAAQQKASEFGFSTLLLTNYLEGEARQVGRFFASIARQFRNNQPPIDRPALILAGGETTVTITGDGKGGRNQELALGAVEGMKELSNIFLITLATDGGDGITDAAGAVVTGDTFLRARQFGLEPQDYLNRNDSYNFFEPLEDLLKIGPTLTNVNDLVFLFAS